MGVNGRSLANLTGPRFRPGQSGNRGGRPKKNRKETRLARRYTDLAIQTLVEVMQTAIRFPSARVSAASEMLSRGWGKPAEVVAGEDDGQMEILVRYVNDLHGEGAGVVP